MSDRKTEFSPCRRYRYTLWREWRMPDLLSHTRGPGYDGTDRYLMVIGLNPSTADETQDDPTIRRCIRFAKDWGYGALCMTNLFAWRDTEPANMKCADEPIGSQNDYWLQKCADGAGMILAAWGKHGRFLSRDSRVRDFLGDLQCLGVNNDGTPKHPLYIRADTRPIPLATGRELEA